MSLVLSGKTSFCPPFQAGGGTAGGRRPSCSSVLMQPLPLQPHASPTATPSPRPKARPLTFLCFLAIHLSQLLSMSSHLDSLCLRTSRGTSSSLWSRGQGPSEVPREQRPWLRPQVPAWPVPVPPPAPHPAVPFGANSRTF